MFLVIVSLIVALGRLFVPGHGPSWPGTYEAFAHIWVGVLLTLSFQGSRPAWYMVGILTGFETVMFLAR